MTVDSNIKLASAIESLHSPTFSEEFDSFLSSLVYMDHAVTMAYYEDRQPIILHKNYSDDLTEDSIVEYIHRAYLLDPVYSAHKNRIADGCYRLEELAPDRFKNTAYFDSYYKETGISDEVIYITYSQTGYSLVLSLFRLENYDEKLSKKEFQILKGNEALILALMKQQWHNFSDPKIHLEKDKKDPLIERIKNAIEHSQQISMTSRQAEIIALTLRGHSATSIGLLLDISPDTVKVHRRNIYAKLRVSSQTELFSMLVSTLGPLSK